MGAAVKTCEIVIQSIYDELSLTKSLKKHGLSMQNFFRGLEENPILDAAYIRAQFALAEIRAEEIIDISDNAEDPQKARNQIDARKWYASKNKPTKYGDRLDLNVNATVDIGSALIEARKRALPHSDPIEVTATQRIELTTTIDATHTGLEPVPSEAASNDALPDIFD